MEAAGGGAGGDPAGARALEGPATFVDDVVMVAAHEGEVVEVGRAPILEELEMVGLAPAGAAVAAGEDATAIAGDERMALLAGGEPDGTTVVEDRAVCTQDDASDASVADEPPRRLDRDRTSAGELTATQVERVGRVRSRHERQTGEVERVRLR